MAAAPDNRRSEAGGLVNLMRVLGCAIGVAAASTALTGRMEKLTIIGNKTGEGPSQTVLTAVGNVLWLAAEFQSSLQSQRGFAAATRAFAGKVVSFDPSPVAAAELGDPLGVAPR